MNGFSIGNILIPGQLVLAPMAGFSNASFRKVAYHFGANLVYTEMISDVALIHKNEQTINMIADLKEQGIVAVQIFGHNPITMAKAAAIAQNLGADIIDINCGCPVKKVVKQQAGSYLLTDLVLLKQIAQAIINAVSIPVTAKIRIGFDENSINALETAKVLEEIGISAIAVHARTRAQFYSGNADWNYIRLIKTALKIPIIGNGDVKNGIDVQRMLVETGCDAVMIGRAAIGNPWIFQQAKNVLECLPDLPITYQERIIVAKQHISSLCMEGKQGILAARPLSCYYIKGMKDSSRYKERLVRASSIEDYILILDELEKSLIE